MQRPALVVAALVAACCVVVVVAVQAGKPPLTRVLSDFHVGSVWFADLEAQESVMQMLESMTHQDTPVTRLVLLGDIFDFWLIPIDQTPMPLEQVVSSSNLYGFNLTRMTETIRSIAENGVDVVFVTQGNHDMELDASLAKFAFGGKVSFVKDTLLFDDVVMHHGHQWDIFNRPDPRGITPYGYYVTRASASTNYKPGHGGNIFVEILTKLWSDKVLSPIIADILEHESALKLVLSQILNAVIPGGNWHNMNDTVYLGGDPYGSGASNFTVQDSIEWYTNLVSLMEAQGWSKTEIGAMVKCSIKDYEYFVRQFPASLAVLGHTHHPMLTTYKRPAGFSTKDPIVYANSGAWVDGGTRTWVDIHFEYATGQHVMKPTHVQLFTMPLPGTLLEEQWMYGPNVTFLHQHVAFSRKSGRLSFSGGPFVHCQGPDCDIDNPSHRHALILLAMLQKAGALESVDLLDTEFTRADGAVAWGGRMYDVGAGALRTVGSGNVPPLVYSPPPSSQSSSLLELASWWSRETSTNVGVMDTRIDSIPATWSCDWRWFGTQDGCDRDCGEVVDPDCLVN